MTTSEQPSAPTDDAPDSPPARHSDWRRREIRRAATNAFKLGSSLLVTWGIALVARLVVPRFLGPDRFGMLNFADAFTATAFVMFGLGLDTYVRKEISIRPEHANDFVGGILALRILMLGFAYAGMELVLQQGHRNEEARLLVHILGAAQFFIIGSNTSGGLLQAAGQVTEMSVLSVITKLVWVTGIAISIWLHLGLWAFAASVAISEGIKSFVLFFLAKVHLGFKLTINVKATAAVIVSSLPFYVSGLATTIYDKIGVTLLAFMGSDREVGWYGAAAGLAGLTLLLAPLISWVLTPLFARAAAASEAELCLMVRRSLDFILTVAIPVSLMMIVGADVWIKLLFGAKFAPAASALRVLAVANALMYVSIVCAYALAVLNATWRMTLVFVCGMVVNPICNMLLIGPALAAGDGGGGVACATSTLVTEVGVVVPLFWMLGRRAVSPELVVRVVKNVIVAALIVALDIWVLRPLGPVRIAIAAVLYVILALVTGAVNPREFVGSVRSAFEQRKGPGDQLRIGFIGNFGTHNLGNECTLSAMLAGARRHLPDAELVGVCNDPADTSERHNVEAVPISLEPGEDFMRVWGPLHRIRRLAWEVGDWLRVMRVMRTLDMLVVTGTGIINDANAGSMGMPYQMFKWVLAARLAGRKIKFVSVGAERLIDTVPLFFLRRSLRLANYRSFRDPVSRQRASALVKQAAQDPMYPDLAFSLPESLMRSRSRAPGVKSMVAVGIYTVQGGEAALKAYIDKIGKFVLWLLDHGYRTRIVLGDRAYDGVALAQLREWLSERGALDRVVDEPVASFEELMVHLGEADLVVATRFHNVLLSLLMGKPVVSISHMDKNDQLMAAMGLSDYCRGMDLVSEADIVKMFEAMAANAPQIRAMLQAKLDLFRTQLEEQYRNVFGEFAHDAAAESAQSQNLVTER